jgi:hypothetical protein
VSLGILSFGPGLANIEAYCRSLDDKRIAFPKNWQNRKGWPKTHLEAWQSKDEHLRNLLKCERDAAQRRSRKGILS